jgi:hypothetical protein
MPKVSRNRAKKRIVFFTEKMPELNSKMTPERAPKRVRNETETWPENGTRDEIRIMRDSDQVGAQDLSLYAMM